jgi:hypothetical protein
MRESAQVAASVHAGLGLTATRLQPRGSSRAACPVLLRASGQEFGGEGMGAAVAPHGAVEIHAKAIRFRSQTRRLEISP